MSLPSAKLDELKMMIHEHLDRMNIHGKIREYVSESLRDREEETEDVGEEGLINSLREKGIIEDLMKGLELKGTNPKNERKHDCMEPPVKASRYHSRKHASTGMVDDTEFPLDPNKRYLYLQIAGGRAFLEHLQDPEPLPGRATSTFTLHVKFREQRFNSRPVPCACEPDIQEGFLIEVQKHPKDPGKLSDAPSLLTLAEKVHLVLTKDELSGARCLLASHYMDWRRILSVQDGKSSFSLELNGIGAENNVPVGVLDVKLSLIPKASKKINSDVVTGQSNLEKSRLSERERLFLVYSKQWWREYLQIRHSHSSRLVKIFAQDENGIHKHACSFVHPLRAGRLIDTPRQAARFVSLIGYDKVPAVAGTRSEMWTSLHAFLCAGKGDVENHSILLCNLLLGFGLNAYVCIGTKGKGVAHSWVATVATDGTVIFWESVAAQRFVHRPINPNDPPSVRQPAQTHPYKTVGCVFNHKEFYANCQPTDSVDLCLFEFTNESLWKGMSLEAIKSVCGPGILPAARQVVTLIPSTIDPMIASNAVENELRALVVEHRNNLGLSTHWDDEMSYLLSPALAAYETEHCLGISAGNEEFQQAIRRNVPDGHTFKGFPVQFNHRNASRMFNTCIKSPVCDEIICCRGDQVRIAVRARVFSYPEETNAVWIMFAVKYKSVL